MNIFFKKTDRSDRQAEVILTFDKIGTKKAIDLSDGFLYL